MQCADPLRRQDQLEARERCARKIESCTVSADQLAPLLENILPDKCRAVESAICHVGKRQIEGEVGAKAVYAHGVELSGIADREGAGG